MKTNIYSCNCVSSVGPRRNSPSDLADCIRLSLSRVFSILNNEYSSQISEAIAGGNYLASAVAATNIEVQFVPRCDLMEIMVDDPITGMELVQMLSGDLGKVYERIRALKFHNAVRPN